jgi:putative CocE/NonD family hydrolase
MQFFRHHLKGEIPDYDDKPPIRLFVMGTNRWRDEWEWPLARTQWASYFLHSNGGANTLKGDGALSLDRAGEEPFDTFVYDPADPVPGPTALGMTGGPEIDPNNSGRRADVLVYTSAPLERDLEVTGSATVELWVATSVSDTDFIATLIDLFPDDTAIPLCRGIVRTRYTESHPMRNGAVYRFDIDLWATSNTFKTGHRIRLHISSSEFPTFDLNPNTGDRITHDASTQTLKATQRVFHDQTRPSRLTLPVIPAS